MTDTYQKLVLLLSSTIKIEAARFFQKIRSGFIPAVTTAHAPEQAFDMEQPFTTEV